MTRRIGWTFLVAALALVGPAPCAADPLLQGPILAGRALGGVEIGMAPSRLRALLGEPARIEGQGWHYPSLHLAVFVKDEAVHTIMLGEPCDGEKDPFGAGLAAAESLSSPDGLKLGSQRDAVLGKQGPPDKRSAAGRVEHLLYLRSGIEFGIGERGVCMIVVRPPKHI